ncbi:MAG: hypothetical protein J6P87_02885 [Lachnospiraceae bacterium]|nr:hypothetical protein [Lachnospiraceae bacterium]
MNEKEYIQYRGFRNIYDDEGNAIGFEFRHRLSYYRGVWLSQLRVGRVIVDGEEILAESGNITWVINGVEYTPEQMATDNVHMWEMTVPATVRVKKPGGLAQGYHDIAIRYGYTSSYMPPIMDQFDDTVEKIAVFGGNTKKRRMLIV